MGTNFSQGNVLAKEQESIKEIYKESKSDDYKDYDLATTMGVLWMALA